MIIMTFIKKINAIGIKNLVEGTVSEVSVMDFLKVVCKDEARLVIREYGEHDIDVIENAYIYGCEEAAIIINDKLVNLIGGYEPLVDCGEYYMTVLDYLKCEWNRGSLDFEHVLLTNGKYLYSRTTDERIGEHLPIWDWCIGFLGDDEERRVCIGDIRSTFYELFNGGYLLEDMIDRLFKYNYSDNE